MLTIKGKGCISATVVADSITKDGDRITTFELEYPRWIHGEFMTHRLLSRNAMSSRAVPIAKMIEQVRNNPAMPIHWGKNQAGMQASEECNSLVNITDTQVNELYEVTREAAWRYAALQATEAAEYFSEAGYHKQIVNRLLEPFQIMKTVATATEWDNFFYLRCHADAQPEIKELAECMYKAMQESKPEELNEGEWHTPYVSHLRGYDGEIVYAVRGEEDENTFDAEVALKISASCCAQVSYRLLDNSIEKALNIYNRLIESKPVHASPTEHQATPIQVYPEHLQDPFSDQEGVTHMDTKGKYWSANFKGWIQYRQTIRDNVCWDYKA